MASSGGNPWQWSPDHQDHYCVTQDHLGNFVYHWYKQVYGATSAGASSEQTPAPRPRGDSGTSQHPNTNVPAMPDPVSYDVRAQLSPYFIPGTPEKGWYEPLDSTYRMRTGSEAYHFFRLGKVFSMLHIQAASAHALQNDNVTVVKYGEQAFSQIRRFIIVEARRGFVYACPITTYSGRGTLKYGCIPREHSIVYHRGAAPTPFQGEHLEKVPICIDPADSSIRIDMASRVHYSKAYPVEMNVKVKDIGDVAPEDLSNFIRYYKEENGLM